MFLICIKQRHFILLVLKKRIYKQQIYVPRCSPGFRKERNLPPTSPFLLLFLFSSFETFFVLSLCSVVCIVLLWMDLMSESSKTKTVGIRKESYVPDSIYLFEVNNRNTRTHFTSFSIVSVVEFEKVHVSWDRAVSLRRT